MKVACIGDSLTAGYYDEGRSWYPYHKTWDTHRYQVTNKGVSGALVSRQNNCLWLGTTVFELQVQTTPYDRIVFMAGTNDLGYHVDLSVIQKAWDLLAGALLQSCDKLVVCTVPNTSFDNPQRDQLNLFIRNWVQTIKTTTNSCVVLCDVQASIPYDAALYDDMLHFNPSGYKRLGQLIRACL